MKNIFKLLGIVAIVAIIGFTMMSCGDKYCGGSGDCVKAKTSGTNWVGGNCPSTDCNAHPSKITASSPDRVNCGGCK